MRRGAILMALVFLCTAHQTSCDKNGTSGSGPVKPVNRAGRPDKPTEPTRSWPAPPQEVGADDLAKLASGNSRFAVDLYRKLAAADGNIAFSPASVSFALAMTYAGARADTAAEMKTTLHLVQEPATVHAAFAVLLSKLMSGGDYEMAIANRLWGDKQSRFLPEFLDVTKKYYNAPLEQVDFRGDPDGARAAINKWVEDQTREKIKDLLKPKIITEITRLVLTNAIYFKGKWEEVFDKGRTHDEPFHTPKGEVKVPTMHQNHHFVIHSDDSLQILELPYKGRDLVMYVILPRARDGLQALEKSLDADKLKLWTMTMHGEQVNVALPRFEAESSFELKKMLEALGMKQAFADTADLSGMNGKQDLYITAVVHKAYVKVDEEGSEAAAATAVVVGKKSGPPRDPVDFIADHPFIWTIYDKKTSSILFLGRVVDPS